MGSESYLLAGKRVWVAGHRGMVGSAIVRRLASECCEILTVDRSEVDLTRQIEVENWMNRNRPHAVFLAAARVGGIHANNTLRAEFIYDNLAIAMHVLHTAYKCKVEKLQFLGSTCIYPRLAPQPLKEEYLLTGELEATNEPYAVAKIAGVKLAQNFRAQYGCDFTAVMPTNLYGPGDNYHPDHSHVAAALIRRFHEAKVKGTSEVVVWGTGRPRREFLFVDDLADACVFAMQRYSKSEILNIGCGTDVSIAELADLVAEVVGFSGTIRFDTTRPDGTPRKLVDVTRMSALGWQASTSLADGLKRAYATFINECATRRIRISDSNRQTQN